MKKVNVGVIGVGRIGKLHAENLVKHINEASLVSIAEVKEKQDMALKLARELNIPQVTDDYREILENMFIRAVIICSPTNTHAQIITEAAKAGKHIFCEKPIDFDPDKIDKALTAVKKAGVKLQIGFNRRFDPDFAEIKHKISTGQVGFVRKVKITSRDPAPPPIEYVKVSGGIFMDMTIHDFDMARFLINCEPKWVFVHGDVMIDSKIGGAGDIDTAEIMIGFQNGEICTIDNCRHSPIGYDQRIEVFGSKDTIFNKNREKNTSFFMERYAKSYILEIQAFVNAILKNKPIPVSGKDGKMAAVMALAAQKSYQEKRVVKISEVQK